MLNINMKSFSEYVKYLEAETPAGGPTPQEEPPSAPVDPMAAGGLGAGPPVGGPSLPMGAAPDPMMSGGGGIQPGASGGKGPLKLKAHNVWDVLEKILMKKTK